MSLALPNVILSRLHTGNVCVDCKASFVLSSHDLAIWPLFAAKTCKVGLKPLILTCCASLCQDGAHASPVLSSKYIIRQY